MAPLHQDKLDKKTPKKHNPIHKTGTKTAKKTKPTPITKPLSNTPKTSATGNNSSTTKLFGLMSTQPTPHREQTCASKNKQHPNRIKNQTAALLPPNLSKQVCHLAEKTENRACRNQTTNSTLVTPYASLSTT